MNDHNDQPPLFGKLGRPYMFHPINYPELIRRLEDVMFDIGFGPVMVGSMLALILKRTTRNTDYETIGNHLWNGVDGSFEPNEKADSNWIIWRR